MFLELACLLKKYEPTLKKHLEEGPQNATYMSNLIQNDLISSLHSVLKRQLVLSLKNKKIIDYSANNQYFADTKKEELRVSCFNVVLDDLLNGLNDRFNQKTLNLILAVGNVLKLQPTKENLLCLESAFEVDCNDLNGEIQLLQNIPGVPLGSTTKTIFHWIEFLNKNNQKNIFFGISLSYCTF